MDGSYVGNCSKVAGWIGDVRVGGKEPTDATGSVGLVGEGEDEENNGGGAISETVRTLGPWPSTKSSILTAELR